MSRKEKDDQSPDDDVLEAKKIYMRLGANGGASERTLNDRYNNPEMVAEIFSSGATPRCR